MKNAQKQAAITLASAKQVPHRFIICIKEPGEKESSGLAFEITFTDPELNFSKTCSYSLSNRTHSSYLDLFEKLAADFGLRVPQNRQRNTKYDFKKKFDVLLVENLVPEMIYGYGDPSVIRVDDPMVNTTYYYLVSTSNDAPDSFPVCRSKDLKDWEFVSFVFPKGKKPQWAAHGRGTSDYWAPEIHQVGDEFRVYFVARDKVTSDLCIGMARSSSPGGPFIAEEEPILTGNMIDPHLFVERDGTSFLYWKEDNNGVWPNRLIHLIHKYPGFIVDLFEEEQDRITASFIQTLWPWIQTLKPMEGFLVQQVLIEAVTSMFSDFQVRLMRFKDKQTEELQKNMQFVLDVMKTPVYVQSVSADGTRLEGERKKIMENDLHWEAHLVEGMWVTKHLNKYYLFYSGNDFSTAQYGVGVATAESPSGPFIKKPEQILRSTEEWWAPGHPSVATGPDGEYMLFLHSFFPGKAGYNEFRALLCTPIKFDSDNVFLQ